MFADATGHGRGGGAQTVLFGGTHLDELPAAADQGGQGQRVGVGQRSDLRPDGIGEVGDDRGVEAVGLGPLTGGLSELPDLAGDNHHHRQPGGGQGGDDRGLVAAGGLQDDPLGLDRDEPGHEVGEARLVAVDAERFAGGA